MAIEQAAADAPRSDDRPAAGRLAQSLRISALICCLGAGFGFLLLQVDTDLVLRSSAGMSLSQYRDQDTIWLGVAALLLAGFLVLRGAAPSDWSRHASKALLETADAKTLRWILLLTGGVVVLVGAGTYLVNHAHLFVVDESLGRFQAAIFAEGRLLARLPEAWRGFEDALVHEFAWRDAENGLWASSYRPVFAAIRALLSLVSLDPLTNTLFSGLSVVLVAAVALRLWPGRRDAALVAALLLATSPQFLVMGMTGFAWPAHLCLNLLWLWLFLRDDRTGHGLAALVGFLAVGLHQVQVHALFVLPFMIGLLWDRRWALAAFYASAYAAAHLLWILWLDIATALTTGAASGGPGGSQGVDYITTALGLVSGFGPEALILMGTNLLRLLAWQNLALLPLLLVAVRPWKALPPVARKLAWGLLLSLLLYLLLMPNQMHGWGYRYFHSLLGGLALLGAFGWIKLTDERATPAVGGAAAFMAAATTAMLLIAIPLRLFQVEAYVGPMAKASRYLAERPSEVVFLDTIGVYFGLEPIRNDPYLRNTPLLLNLSELTPDQVADLCRTYASEVVGPEDFADFGVIMVPPLLTEDRGGFADLIEPQLAVATGPACATPGALPE